MLDHLGVAAHAAGDHRRTEVEDLEQGVGEPLVEGVQDEDVRSADVEGDPRVRHVAQPVDARAEPQSVREGAPLLLAIPIAGDEEVHVLGQSLEGTDDPVHPLPAHEAADGQHVPALGLETELGARLGRRLGHVLGARTVVAVEDALDLVRGHAVALDEDLPEELRARDDVAAPAPPAPLECLGQAHPPAVALALEGHDLVAVAPALAVGDLPGAVDHDADHDRPPPQAGREHVEQGEVLVDVDDVGPAGRLQHLPEGTQVAQREGAARDGGHWERMPARGGVRAERHHPHLVPALLEEAGHARHVHRRPPQVGREDGGGHEHAHGGSLAPALAAPRAFRQR